MNRKVLYLLAGAVVLSLSVASAFASESDGRKTQQNRMASCSHEAKELGLKGEERQKFMSHCLKGEPRKANEKEAPRKTTAEAPAQR